MKCRTHNLEWANVVYIYHVVNSTNTTPGLLEYGSPTPVVIAVGLPNNHFPLARWLVEFKKQKKNKKKRNDKTAMKSARHTRLDK